MRLSILRLIAAGAPGGADMGSDRFSGSLRPGLRVAPRRAAVDSVAHRGPLSHKRGRRPKPAGLPQKQRLLFVRILHCMRRTKRQGARASASCGTGATRMARSSLSTTDSTVGRMTLAASVLALAL